MIFVVFLNLVSHPERLLFGRPQSLLSFLCQSTGKDDDHD